MLFPHHPTTFLVVLGGTIRFSLEDACSAKYQGETYVGESPQEEEQGCVKHSLSQQAHL